MSIKKRCWTTADGSERVAWRVRYRMDGVEFCKQFDSRDAAERYSAMTVINIQDGLHIPDSKSLSFDVVAQYYLEHKQPKVSEATYATYVREIAIAIKYIGQTLMSQLNPQVSHRFLDQLMKMQDVTESHRFKAWISYKKVMKFAYERGYIHSDACSMIDYPAGVREKSRRDKYIPGTEEVQDFLHVIAGYDNKVMVLVLSLTGLRIGECQGLWWSDIDFDKQVLTVRRSVSRDGRMGLPKTRSSNRIVPLSAALCNCLKQWRLQSVRSSLSDYVFPGTRGKAMWYESIVQRWSRAWELMPLNAIRFTPHALRHHYASRLIERKFSDLQIMTWMGHKDLTTTYKTYGHLLSEAIPRAQIDGLSNDLSL